MMSRAVPKKNTEKNYTTKHSQVTSAAALNTVLRLHTAIVSLPADSTIEHVFGIRWIAALNAAIYANRISAMPKGIVYT